MDGMKKEWKRDKGLRYRASLGCFEEGGKGRRIDGL
jgi:hypothetical protein